MEDTFKFALNNIRNLSYQYQTNRMDAARNLLLAASIGILTLFSIAGTLASIGKPEISWYFLLSGFCGIFTIVIIYSYKGSISKINHSLISLEKMQQFLLAASICENIESDLIREEALSKLIFVLLQGKSFSGKLDSDILSEFQTLRMNRDKTKNKIAKEKEAYQLGEGKKESINFLTEDVLHPSTLIQWMRQRLEIEGDLVNHNPSLKWQPAIDLTELMIYKKAGE